MDVVRRHYRQRSVFEILLPDGDKLWDPELKKIDELLDDEELVDTIQARLEKRHPQVDDGGGRAHRRKRCCGCWY